MARDPSTESGMSPAEPDDRSQAARLESSQRTRILFMALAVFAGGFLLYREMAHNNPNLPGAGGGGGASGYSWEVADPDGAPVDLNRYKGRPVLLNVWATWCPPCMMEMPSLIALSERPELAEADVAVVLVSVDGDLEPVRRYLQRTEVGNADVLVAAAPPPGVFNTSGIPATFLIDPEGRVVRREVGAMDWNTDEIATELTSLADAR